jgi:hypothetical protein
VNSSSGRFRPAWVEPPTGQIYLIQAQVPDLAGQQSVQADQCDRHPQRGTVAGLGAGTDGLRLLTRTPQAGLAKTSRSTFKMANRLRSMLAWARQSQQILLPPHMVTV